MNAEAVNPWGENAAEFRSEPAAHEVTLDGALDDSLDSRLAVIEHQPLEARAAAYVQLHDQLSERLEGGDVPRSANG